MKSLSTILLFILVATQIAIAQFSWEPTNGPNGIYISHYAQNDHTIFANTYGGLYRSFDGVNWEKILSGYITDAPVIHGDSILVTSFPAYDIEYPNFEEKTTYLSQDNGETWMTIPEPTLPEPNASSKPVAICSSGIYFMQWGNNISNNLLKSEDSGLTWAPANIPPSNHPIYFHGEKDNKLVIFADNTCWQSEENGENWSIIYLPIGAFTNYNFLFSGDTIFFPANTHPIDSAYISTNKGITWQKKPLITDGSSRFSLIGSTLYSYDSGAGTTNHFMARSDDFGLTWQEIPVNHSIYVRDVGRIQDKTFIGSYQSGILELNETTGETKPILNNLTEGGVSKAKLYENNIWVGNSQGIFRYNTNSQIWDTISTQIATGYFQFFEKEDNLIIAKFSDDNSENIWVSEDNGNTWTSKPVPIDYQYEYLVNATILNQNIFAVDSECHILVSKNNGDTWTVSQGQNFGWSCSESQILKFKNKYYIHNREKILTSTNGIDWTLVSQYPGGRVVELIATEDYLFMQLTKDIQNLDCFLYKSKDGINWEWANDGLPQATLIANGYQIYSDNTWKAKMFQQNESTYFYNYFYGLYVSHDTCKTWYPVYHLLPNMIMKDNKVYAGKYTGLHSSLMPKFYGALMAGTVFDDKNGNGIQDNNEEPLSNIKVSIKSPSTFANYYFVHTKDDGSYTLGVTPNDTDTLSLDIKSDYISQIKPPFYATNNTASIKDFAVQFQPNVTDLTVTGGFGFPPRPGFDLNLNVFYKNKGTILKGGKLSITLGDNLDFIEAVPSAQLLGDSLVWDIDDLAPLESGKLMIHTKIPAGTPLNDHVSFHGYFSPNNSTDIDPTNNYFETTDTIVGSFDPNDKKVSPARGLTIDEILDEKELIYTIRFQNTGTFFAEKVRITDQLDTALNLTTFRLVGASHEITELALRPGGMLEITFNDIMLLDSTSNEPASHGFVSFAIQRKKDYIDENWPVYNSAKIYFDYNEPITTNTVSSPIAEPVQVLNILPNNLGHLNINPNPTFREFTVKTKTLKGSGYISLWDTSGRLVKEVVISNFSNTNTISVELLKPGAYFLLASDKEHIISEKIIVAGQK